MRVILVGSNPSIKSPDNSAFHASTRSRIIVDEWFKDLDVDIHFENIVGETRPGNIPLRLLEIKAALPALKNKIDNWNSENCVIVALGRSAEQALALLKVQFLYMPHPSGRNRYWNNLDNKRAAIEKLHEYIDERRRQENNRVG